MSIFRKETPAPEPEVSGTDAIRARVWSRWKKANLSITSRELQIPLPKLEAFAKGEGNLSVAHMHLLCKEFYYHTAFDPEKDRLVDISPPAAKAGGPPPEPYRNPNGNIQKAIDEYHAALRAARGPEPARPKSHAPPENVGRFAKRPGFA